MERLRLTLITILKFVVLLFLNQPALCTSNGSSLEAAAISIPASEQWYVT